MNIQYHRWTPGGLSVLVHDKATNEAIWNQIQSPPEGGKELEDFASWAGVPSWEVLSLLDETAVGTSEPVGRYFISYGDLHRKYIDKVIEGELVSPVVFMGVEVDRIIGRLPLDIETMEEVVFDGRLVCAAVRKACLWQLKEEYNKYKALADAVKDLIPSL